ncbi:hypothetical protein [Klebsiella variicola]|uniref:hypothetical protein n=1 Tax=Klebsiella variicola TaxID=244366 RepID=UPI002230653F|nr:hypothetical protein [Klebsiella variicola]
MFAGLTIHPFNTSRQRLPLVAGGFVQVGDDDDLNGEAWSVAPMEYREDGSIVYQVGGIEGDVLFEEASHD